MQHPPGTLESWTLTKPAVTARHGLVASQHYAASQIGAEVLRAGGNAVDAAIATSFALGVLEPWMSGVGGGGFMLVYAARERRVTAVDFGMIAPQALDPADYPLVAGRGADLFNWPAVYQDRNLKGYHAMTVPGQVAGMALARDTFGTHSWAELLAPAIGLAEAGLAVDWYATLKIAAAARHLAEFPASRDTYLPDGFAPAAEWGGPLPRISQTPLAATLKRLAEAGPADFYTGELAAALVADVAAGGGRLAQADLANYRARLLPVSPFSYRDAQVYSAPGLTAGPTLHHALQELAARLTPTTATPDASAYAAYADSLLHAYAARLGTLGDSDDSAAPACTTHISVVDREGNLVALTQTLLSVFGCKVVLPQTGILMNNGIMWFDPRPGGPNSLAPGKRPLSNMCPTLLERADGSRIALGASGGRRILPAVYQLVSFLADYGMDLEQAFQQPRLDVSGTDLVTLDARLAALAEALATRFSVRQAVHGIYPNLFACPNAVSVAADGRQQGSAFIPSPWAAVAGAD